MERFNHYMDDIKDALSLSYKNKGLFLPALITNILLLVVGIGATIFIIVSMVGAIASFEVSSGGGANWQLITTLIVISIVFTLIFALMMIAIDVGISGLVIAVVDGEAPSSKAFFSAIKAHLVPVFLTKFALVFIYTIALIVLILPIALYFVTVGILTGGWGMIFLTLSVQTFLSYWVLIKVEDHRGGFESIGINIRFGKRNFWLIILIMYVQYCMAAFLPSLLGLIGAALASIFISYTIATIMKIILLKSYRRYRVPSQ